jgi:hypothetical protein
MGASDLSGGCLCGAVRYRVTALQHGATVCHCRTCQQAGGGPFMVFAPVAHADFALTQGALTLYRSSDIAERGFCGACGSPLTYRGFTSDHVSVAVGTLDEPARAAPSSQLAAEQALPWLKPSLETPNTKLADWLNAL